MKYCLTCRTCSSRDALFCAACGRSFGCRLCRLRHTSPPGAKFCVQCGSTDLSLPTSYLPLGWLPLLLATGLIFMAGRWLLGALNSALNRSLPGPGRANPTLPGFNPVFYLDHALGFLLPYLILGFILWALLPASFKRRARFRRGSSGISYWMGRMFISLLRWLAWLFEGRQNRR